MFFDAYAQARDWANNNQGVISIAIFLLAILFGWVTGIFSALRRKAKFKLGIIDGPTFCCTHLVGTTDGGSPIHRTSIAIHLNIANVGTAAASVEEIYVGYHMPLRPWSAQWLMYTIGWFWLKQPTVALSDFQYGIGDQTKIYPFLIQASPLALHRTTTYLEVGQSTAGVIYYEQDECYGGFFPSIRNGHTRIKIRVKDVFGKQHSAKFTIPSVTLDEARKYNPYFGETLITLQKQD